MADLREISHQIEEETANLREQATGTDWARLSRKGFVFSLRNIIPGLEGLLKLFQEARNEIAKNPDESAPELGDHIGEINRLLVTLKRNLELEEGRSARVVQRALDEIADRVTTPELYSDLEQKTLAILLKSNYLVERIRLFERKKEPVIHVKAAQRNVLDLLQKREEEVATLRKKYDETRKNTFMGLIEKEGTNEIEKDLNEVARSIESKTALLRKSFEAAKMFHEQFQRQALELEQKVISMEELEAQMTGKTFELITMLKKERDYAKKMLIEIEHETIQLRNTYSKELIGLQEEKLHLKNSIEEKYLREIAELKSELRHRAEVVKHLHENAGAKDRKISNLEQENEKLHVVNRTFEKHHEVKQRLLGGKESRDKKSKKKSI